MPELVYLLCALTSFACAALLFRGWLKSKVRLLAFSTICFSMFALNNALLLVDLLVVPTIDLSVVRGLAALVGVSALLCGMIWDSK